jgi:Uma2 family endonuclease
MSPAEYLAMHFPDREPEYVRGELRYKPMPDLIHGILQALLAGMLINALRRHGFQISTQVRCQIEEDNFRLPAVAVLSPEQPLDLVPTQPVFLAVEIVSKDDKHSELLEKLEDYRAWRVPNIWVIDPRRRKLSVFDASGLRTVDALRLPQHKFELHLHQLMEGIDMPQ